MVSNALKNGKGLLFDIFKGKYIIQMEEFIMGIGKIINVVDKACSFIQVEKLLMRVI
jgi:hypothetical protein